MNWKDLTADYDELYPHEEQPTQRRVVDTPTGKKEVVDDEIIDNPIKDENRKEEPVQVEERQKVEEGDNDDNGSSRTD